MPRGLRLIIAINLLLTGMHAVNVVRYWLDSQRYQSTLSPFFYIELLLSLCLLLSALGLWQRRMWAYLFSKQFFYVLALFECVLIIGILSKGLGWQNIGLTLLLLIFVLYLIGARGYLNEIAEKGVFVSKKT